MSVHLTEEEQVEALKTWWKENGKSVVGGIVIGLGLVFGWQGWNQHKQSQAEMASAEYDRMLVLIDQGDLDTARRQADLLNADYSSTAYDFFAALELAKAQVAKNELAAARTQLEFAVAHAENEDLAQIARIRLVRLLLAMKNFDAAETVIGEARQDDAFKGDLAVLQGDIARLKNDPAAAYAAYEKALQQDISERSYVEMKMIDVKSAAAPNS